MQPFAELLRDYLNHAGLSQSRFAELADTDQGFISQILAETRRPPLNRIGDWATILDLDPETTQQFIDAAHLAHSTQHVRDMVADLRRRLDENA
ncbi:MAG: XRE family transcriptional regulator [Planctomycetota bacterium]|nr:MAG: XRE family transcriptional regulator [Planctomycetota bacterium]